MANKVAIIISNKNFRDEECFESKQIFLDRGFDIKIASDKLGEAEGRFKGKQKVDIELKDLNVSDFDAIVFIGGPGAPDYLDNAVSYKIAREAFEKNKVIGAICISPVILAKSGILEGKKATVWSSEAEKVSIKILLEFGAEYQSQGVVADENIITASGPEHTKQFAQKIAEVLTLKEK